jgi:hypothetical protein
MFCTIMSLLNDGADQLGNYRHTEGTLTHCLGLIELALEDRQVVLSCIDA